MRLGYNTLYSEMRYFHSHTEGLGMRLGYSTLYSEVRYNMAVDKWVLGGAKAPPNFWHLYLKDIAHSHSTKLLIMCERK